MAEINIQRKERSIWPWLLAGVLLLGLLWFLFARNTENMTTSLGADTVAVDTTGTAAGTLVPPPDTSSPPPPR